MFAGKGNFPSPPSFNGGDKMADFTPITTVQLMNNVPLFPDNTNQIYFDNATHQNQYFTSRVYKTSNNLTYQRDYQVYALQAEYDNTITSCNYLRYRNNNYGNKWFYAFITSIRYVNPNTVYIDFILDAYQTFMFDITWKDCFIERSHVRDDTLGAHTLDEGIHVGNRYSKEVNVSWPGTDVFAGNVNVVPIIFLAAAYVFPSSGDPTERIITSNVQGTPTTLAVWFPNFDVIGTAPLFQMQQFLKLLQNSSKSNAIVASVAIPEHIARGTWNMMKRIEGAITEVQADPKAIESGAYLQISIQQFVDSVNATLTLTPLMSYTPRNKKLYCYPFTYFVLSSNQGENVTIKTEWLPETQPPVGDPDRELKLSLSANISPDSSYFCKVTNANSTSRTLTCTMAQLPQVATASSTYANWLAGHMASITSGILANGLQIFGGTAATVSGAGASAGIGGITSGVNGIIGTIGNLIDAEKMPASLNSSGGSTGNAAINNRRFSLYQQVLNPDMYASIDQFFDMYGYKVNMNGTPDFYCRAYWQYFKIPIVNITGNVPAEYMNQIKSTFRNGVTLWNYSAGDGVDVGNYRNGYNPILT
jgi:hypothetical protein